MTAKWKQRLRREAQAFGQLLRPARLAPLAAGAAILTFGLHNIHAQTGITEGGVLGLLLFVNHWTGLPASVVSPVLDLLCYLLALRFLGGQFIRTSLISTAAVALCFKFWESFPCLLPDLSGAPLAAALLGGVFVGVGVGVIVRGGGSSGGLITDLTVLALSLSYIPVGRIACSLVTVTLSSLLIDKIQDLRLPCQAAGQKE